MIDPQWFDERRRLFSKRRWYHSLENVVLAVAVAGLCVSFVFAWMRADAIEAEQECVQIYKQGLTTTQATGTLWRDGRGRYVCEVRRG